MMLNSEEWARLVVFEKELQRLNSLGKESVVKAWLKEEIEKLRERLNDS